MIRVTRLNGHPLVLNSDLIKFIEGAPDTVITLTNGEKVIVRESEEEVVRRITEFRRSMMMGDPAFGEAPRATTLTAVRPSVSTTPEGQSRG